MNFSLRIPGSEKLNKWREGIFFLSLILCVGVLPFSEALVSISAGILLFQTLILQSWNHRSVMLRGRKSLFLLISIYIVYLFGVLFTQDFQFALYELKKVIFWIVIPLAVCLSPRLSDEKILIVIKIFITAVVAASLVYLLRLFLKSDLNPAEFRDVSIVSHIRFSLQVVLAIVFSGWLLKTQFEKNQTLIRTAFWVILIFWLIVFLFILKSLLGIISFGITGVVALIYYAKSQQKKTFKKWLVAVVIAAVLLPLFYVANVVTSFYGFGLKKEDFSVQKTINGNPYIHDFNNVIRENGTLVYTFICEPELEKEWNKRSERKYSDLLNGYPLSSTLIRYMSSKGLRKDSVGVSQLADKDISLINKGVTNYKFENAWIFIYPRIYETVWELDYYFKTGDPNNKTLAQRIEFVKASLFLIKHNLFVGIGTGNWKIKYNEAYGEMHSKLLPEKRGPSHNQYLNYMVKFGILGFLWITFAIIAPVFIEKQQKNVILILFLTAIAAANLGDSNLETHMGLSFFILFYSIFLWNSTEQMEFKS